MQPFRVGDPNKHSVLVFTPTGFAAVNLNGTEFHAGLVIPWKGTKLLLND